ncbi:MAG TPA: hypothetical protein VJ751_08435 [Pyrinomonadaceae bacterium]|nr:hypothetical protein [Pyrinomonadaceae bacterium]
MVIPIDLNRAGERQFSRRNDGEKPINWRHSLLAGTVSVAGLGGNPYRDGSYEYYLSEKVVTNDPKGIGALILAATEMETAAKWDKKSKLSTKKK